MRENQKILWSDPSYQQKWIAVTGDGVVDSDIKLESLMLRVKDSHPHVEIMYAFVDSSINQ